MIKINKEYLYLLFIMKCTYKNVKKIVIIFIIYMIGMK